MTSVDDRSSSPEHAGDRPRTPGSLIARIVLTTVCLLLLVMWIYAFFFATKDAAYQVEDQAWRDRAQEICLAADAERLELADTSEGFIEHPTPEQALRRADIVERATDIMETELDDLVAVQPEGEQDQRLVAEYEGFYRILIADRRAYIERLRAFDLSPYSETAVEGGPVTNVLTDFANVNRIRACVPPDELGAGG